MNNMYEENKKLAEIAGRLEEVLKRVKDHEKKVNEYLSGKR